jgi:hypothetical protein
LFSGSFVVILSRPIRGTPATADEGTAAVTFNAPDAPAATTRRAGETANAGPMTAASTVRSLSPVFWIVTVTGAEEEPQSVIPRSNGPLAITA